jgi:hypothetical protein
MLAGFVPHHVCTPGTLAHPFYHSRYFLISERTTRIAAAVAKMRKLRKMHTLKLPGVVNGVVRQAQRLTVRQKLKPPAKCGTRMYPLLTTAHQPIGNIGREMLTTV